MKKNQRDKNMVERMIQQKTQQKTQHSQFGVGVSFAPKNNNNNKKQKRQPVSQPPNLVWFTQQKKRV